MFSVQTNYKWTLKGMILTVCYLGTSSDFAGFLFDFPLRLKSMQDRSLCIREQLELLASENGTSGCLRRTRNNFQTEKSSPYLWRREHIFLDSIEE